MRGSHNELLWLSTWTHWRQNDRKWKTVNYVRDYLTACLVFKLYEHKVTEYVMVNLTDGQTSKWRRMWMRNLRLRKFHGWSVMKRTTDVEKRFRSEPNIRPLTGVRSCRTAAVKFTVDVLEGARLADSASRWAERNEGVCCWRNLIMVNKLMKSKQLASLADSVAAARWAEWRRVKFNELIINKQINYKQTACEICRLC